MKQSVYVHVNALRWLQRFISLAELPSTGALGLIKVPKLPQRIGGYHSLEEIEKMLAAANNPMERAVLELAFAPAG